MKKFNRAMNIFLFVVLAYVLYLRAPSIFHHFKLQDQKVSNFQIPTLDGDPFILSREKRVILLFWATWCGPCEVELKRINKMIKAKKINTSDVLAVLGDEDLELAREVVRKNNYLFRVGLDRPGDLYNYFKVSGTPTIVFVDENQKIDWITSGLSPSLEMRLSAFLQD